MVFAGGFTNESQMFKSMAMSDLGDGPLVKAIGMARAPILAVMKSEYFARLADTHKLPKSFSDQYTHDPANFFIKAQEIQRRFPDMKIGKDIPWGAIGLNTYMEDRIGEGLKQLMAGSRKFKLDLLKRDDIAALTEYAGKVTGIETFDQMADRTMSGILENW
jgi:hypothetical protein